MKSRNFFYSLTSIVLTSFLVSVFIVFAADPVSPFTPAENVQDPGDPGTGWGGCGPTDPNCYVTFAMPSAAIPTVDSDGEIAYDTTVADFSTGVIRFYGTEEQGIVTMPIGEFIAPSDGQLVAYNATNDEFELVAPAGVSADSLDFDDFVDAMTLDANTSIAEAAGLELTINKTFTNNTSESGLVLNLTASDTGSATTSQYGLTITNSASTEGADALIFLNNADTDDSVADAIRIQSAAGTILTGIDFDDTDIVTDIELQNGETIDNNTNGTIQLTSTDVNLSGDLIVTGADLWVGNYLIKAIGTRSLAMGGAGTPSVNDSLFFGQNAGSSATSANFSIFLGQSAGSSGSSADSANFIGSYAGYQATSAENSNFLGYSAGYQASAASNSNFIGYGAGYTATNAAYSSFIGQSAGYGATNAGYAVFIGYNAGFNDTVNSPNNLGSPILIGHSTSTGGFSRSIAIGNSATNTANNQLVFGGSSSANQAISSVFFGSGALATSPVGVTINGSGASGTDIAGASITLAGGKATGNALGGSLIFQTSDAGASGATLQSLSTKATILPSGFFGINDTTPDYRLDIETDVASYVANFFNDGNATTRSGILIQGGLDDHTAVGPSTLIGFQDGDGGAVGSISFGSSATAYNTTSDQRLKDTVNERTESSLDLLNEIQIHDFTWKGDTHHTVYAGVYAQELYDVYPHAVTKPVKDSDNWMVDYSKLTPVVVASIQDLDIKLRDVSDFDEEDNSFGNKLRSWLANAENKITRIFTGEICLTEPGEESVCINRAELQSLKNLLSQSEEDNHQHSDISSSEEEEPEVVNPGEENPSEENPTEEVVEEVVEDIDVPLEEVVESEEAEPAPAPVEEEPAS